MPGKLAFLVNTLPDFISEPIKVLSIISSDNNGLKYLEQILRHSHVYRGSGITNVLEIIDSVYSTKHSPQITPKPYYSLIISSNDNVLMLDSKNPGSIRLSLDEHTYNHHSYAGRYIKFKKSMPAKGSPQFTVHFEANTMWESEMKYVKDLRALVSEVFACANMVLSTNSSSAVVESLCINTHKNAKIQQTPLFLPAELQTSQKLAESIDPPSGDDVIELYEFLSLLHLNSLPDYTNSHVCATSTYEIPSIALKLGLPLKSSLLLSVKDVNPEIFYDLARVPGCLSLQATTSKENYLVLNIDNNVWTWTTQR